MLRLRTIQNDASYGISMGIWMGYTDEKKLEEEKMVQLANEYALTERRKINENEN